MSKNTGSGGTGHTEEPRPVGRKGPPSFTRICSHTNLTQQTIRFFMTKTKKDSDAQTLSC